MSLKICLLDMALTSVTLNMKQRGSILSLCKSDYEVNITTLPIRPFLLTELERSGGYKNACKDAKRAFEPTLKDLSLVNRDKCGNLVVRSSCTEMTIWAVRL